MATAVQVRALHQTEEMAAVEVAAAAAAAVEVAAAAAAAAAAAEVAAAAAEVAAAAAEVAAAAAAETAAVHDHIRLHLARCRVRLQWASALGLAIDRRAAMYRRSRNRTGRRNQVDQAAAMAEDLKGGSTEAIVRVTRATVATLGMELGWAAVSHAVDRRYRDRLVMVRMTMTMMMMMMGL
jgi:hypothetical protein